MAAKTETTVFPRGCSVEADCWWKAAAQSSGLLGPGCRGPLVMLVPQASGSWGTPWATATSWEVSPAGLGPLCWAFTLGEKPPLLHSPGVAREMPLFPGCWVLIHLSRGSLLVWAY